MSIHQEIEEVADALLARATVSRGLSRSEILDLSTRLREWRRVLLASLPQSAPGTPTRGLHVIQGSKE